jgi:hypothetical protein
MGTAYSTYGPTPMHIESLDIAKSIHEKIRKQLLGIVKDEIPALKKELDAAGAPNIEGFLD